MNTAAVSRLSRARAAAARSSRLLVLPLCGVLVALSTVVLQSPASAANYNVYNLSAEADSLHIDAIVPGAPVVTEIDASPYGASSSLDSLGQSSSDAGAPYSPVVLGLPSTVNGLFSGELPPLPPVPGYVHSSYPSTPSDKQQQLVYSIAATSGADTSEGAVDLGADGVSATKPTFSAQAQTTANDDGSVTASATAAIDLVNVAGLIDIGNVSSTVTMKEQAGKAPTITSSIDLGSVSIAGIKVDLLSSLLTDKSVSTALGSVINGILKSSGIALTVLPTTYVYTDGTSGTTLDAKKIVESVDSGALQLKITKTLPALGDTITTMTLGRVFVSATNDPGAAPIGESGGGGSVSTGTTTTGVGSTGLATTTTTSDGGGSLLPGVTVPTVTTPSQSTPVGTGETSAPPGSQLQGRSLVAAVNRLGPSAQGLYLLLVFSALTALLGALLIRLVGVRLSFSRPFN